MKQGMKAAANGKKMTLEEKLRLRQIEKSNQMVTLPEAEMDLYARLILYRAQKDLFDLLIEGTGRDDIEWADYICVVGTSEEERDDLYRIISFGVTERFCSDCFDFTVERVEFLRKDDVILEDGTLKLLKRFSEEAGIQMMEVLFSRMQYVYYEYLLNLKKENMPWKIYLEKLMQDEKMFRTLVMAFRDAVAGIDFKHVWEMEKIPEMQQGMMAGIYRILSGRTDTGGGM